MLAIITIPHQRPARIRWYDDAQKLIEDAEDSAEANGHTLDQHGSSEAVINAACELCDDLHGWILVRSAADLTEVRQYIVSNSHQAHRIAALLPELEEEFAN